MKLRESIGQRLHGIIRSDILSGRYQPGERLYFDKIAKENDVSMTPIKEAFLLLEKENLVITRARRGTFVRLFSKKDLEEYYQIRLALEFLAVSLICQDGLDKEYEDQLIKTCDNLQTHAIEKKPHKCILDDIEFHSLLVKACRNDQLFNLIQTLPLTNLYSFTEKAVYYMEHSDMYQQQHREIIQRLKERDEDRAKQLLISHIHIL